MSSTSTCEIHSRVLRRNEELIRRKLSLELPQRTSIKQERKQSLCYEVSYSDCNGRDHWRASSQYVPGIQQNLVERQKDKKSERSLTYELSPFYQQGLLGTCSSHALGKCVVDGFMRGIYVPGRSVDFNQDVVIQVLNNEHKVKIW